MNTNKNHILSLNEIRQSDFSYIEFRSDIFNDLSIQPCCFSDNHEKNNIIIYLKDIDGYSFKYKAFIPDYNVTWRCWKEKPSYIDMMKTAWRHKGKHEK